MVVSRAVTFLIVAPVAALPRFIGAAAAATCTARDLFALFVVLFPIPLPVREGFLHLHV